MKRYGNLWPEIIKFENILQAARQAQRGKRFRENVLEFNYNLEIELLNLKAQLESKTYQPGNYKTFLVLDRLSWKMKQPCLPSGA
jgi:RNA-directed DNA polymerase